MGLLYVLASEAMPGLSGIPNSVLRERWQENKICVLKQVAVGFRLAIVPDVLKWLLEAQL